MAKTSKIEKIGKEKFQKIVNNCSSLKKVMEKCDLSTKGTGNYVTIKRFIKKWDIDCSLLNKNKKIQLAKKGFEKRIPLKDILVEQSTYSSRFHLKQRLIDNGILENKCDECGLSSNWNNKPLSLQLDHKNGVSNDNRIENLRFLCPNCHSQTENFSGKSLKKEKRKSTRKQARPGTRKVTNRPSKSVLQKQIDKIGYSGVARQYGVSDNAIRKWLKSPYDN